MPNQTILLLLIILAAVILFISNKLRYDVTAVIILMIAVLFNIIPLEQTFIGFANPAVITVACVMIISKIITNSGVLLPIISFIEKYSDNQLVYISLLTVITASLSAFMNNVGALGLMMPIALKISSKSKLPLSKVLMPMAFASVLGGLCTAIGTPSNILISSFRMDYLGEPYHLLDFTPMGIIIAIASLSFIIMLGWRILPNRQSNIQQESMNKLLEYLTEIKILADSPLMDLPYQQFETAFDEKIVCLGFIRNKRRKLQITTHDKVQINDIVIIETSPEQLKTMMQNKYLEVIGDTQPAEIIQAESMAIVEAVVPQGSRMENRSANSMRLRNRFDINIVGISREGTYIKERIKEKKLQGGDVVLLFGKIDNLIDTTNTLGLLPLTQHITPKSYQEKYLPILLFIISIILIAAKILPIAIAFTLVIIGLLITKTISINAIYTYIEWPIIILLGAMIPFGNAMQSTGTNTFIANVLLNFTNTVEPIFLLGSIMFITMLLSDVINNSATAVIMAPIALKLSHATMLNPDPFLMAVAIGASCSFLTPISHQNNTLVFGPGGYKFYDYIKLGLPIEIIILIVTLPILPIIWPL